MTIESTIERARAEIESGRLWRAKEILASSLATYGFSRAINLAYADVLYSLGDRLDAGKYYLLSVDEPNQVQRPAVQLFLDRYRKDDWQQLVSRFPASARTVNVAALPNALANHLLVLGAPAELQRDSRAGSLRSSIWLNYWLPFGCLAAALAIGTCALVGAYTILNWFLFRI